MVQLLKNEKTAVFKFNNYRYKGGFFLFLFWFTDKPLLVD